mmetsp:Transcript_14825/g.23085  ORF Transcript_14825/g.23085 Transcript_14825/m.23085 type:complete len:169 (+) Transcript_14825:158-664(+)
MKAAWDQLGDEFKDSKTVLIGDVDCTSDKGKSVCSEHGVRGYPTIKFTGAGGDWEDYKGGRDFASLKSFAESSLGPPCSLGNKDACKPEQIEYLNEWEGKSSEDRKKAIEEMEKEVADANKAHDEFVKTLQAQFQESKKKSEDTAAKLKPKVSLLKSLEKAASGKTEL